MATGEPTPKKRISAAELDAVLDQAREEGWQELALIGPGRLDYAELDNGVSEARTFFLEEEVGPRIAKVASLGELTKLTIRDNRVGDEEARELARLTKLTWLDVSGNEIGSHGAQELARLTNLTSLDVSDNEIGGYGAQELARLTKLTWLDVSDNGIGDHGAQELARLTKLTWLDVSGNEIGDYGAQELAERTALTWLSISNNRITDDGMRELAQLTKLTWLDVSDNLIGDDGLYELPALTKLTSLSVSNNEIGDHGAQELARLTKLTWLDVSGNRIRDEGARELARLTKLTRLDISYNRIEEQGARELARLTKLTWLDISYNSIRGDGAQELARLTKLTWLDVRDNDIGNRGVKGLAALTNLTWLNVSDNRIGAKGVRALLKVWCERPRLEALQYLDLRGNGDLASVLPPELLESTDAQAILAAYRRYREAEQRNTLRPLNEAKMVVVGNEAVGKTSLIRYLVHGKARNPDEQKTPGAEIHEKIEVSTWSPHQSQVRLNVWDFGGQEIMRGTHRFFLTERSLYLLVLEDRREDDRSIYEWLEVIAQRGGDSPVIVVINKSERDLPRLLLDEEALRRDYPAIVGFERTSCNADDASARSIAALRLRIVTTLIESVRLKHVRDSILPTWLRIKEAIAEQARDRSVLLLRDFESLCETDAVDDKPVRDPHEQRALLLLLHHLGVVFAHGLREDVPGIQNLITILDPNWLTGAIYTLIDSSTVREQSGELLHTQLSTILGPSRYPEKWHGFVLSMMQEPSFGLCFPIAHSDPQRYLLPSALPIKEPYYGMWPKNALRYRFDYSLLPNGFIPRLIVEAHRNLTENPTWWRTGVVLSAEGCNILVRADTRRNRVDISVAGETGQRVALNVVRSHFHAVHSYYAKLTFTERVPLPDHPEVDIDYQHLVKLEGEKGLDYMHYPEGARREYTVRELLEGVRDATDPRERRRRARSEEEDPMFQYDLAVLVPLQEEFRIWHPHLQDPNPETREHHTYYTTTRNQRSLVTTFIGDMGPNPATAVASALLRQYRPRLLVVLGIAGALKDDIDLGDVVVATEVDAYLDAGKASGDDQYELRPGGTSFRAEARLVNLVRNLEFQHAKVHQRWQRACETRAGAELPRAKVPVTPTLHNGKIASGPFVAASEPFRDWLLRRDRSSKAVEMEAAGAHWAAERASEPRPALLVLRGISDDATPNKADLDKTGKGAIRRHAMHNAIDLLLALIDEGLLP